MKTRSMTKKAIKTKRLSHLKNKEFIKLSYSLWLEKIKLEKELGYDYNSSFVSNITSKEIYQKKLSRYYQLRQKYFCFMTNDERDEEQLLVKELSIPLLSDDDI
jgi:hypothetical protein